MFRFLASAAMALLLSLTSVWAAGPADPAHFRLTPALLDRMEAVTAEANKQPGAKKEEDDDNEADAESVEDIARKLDANPRTRALLARHGLTSIEFATGTLAAMHAGMALAMEKAPGAAKQAQGFTPAQRANIELLRARKKK